MALSQSFYLLHGKFRKKVRVGEENTLEDRFSFVEGAKQVFSVSQKLLVTGTHPKEGRHQFNCTAIIASVKN